MNLLSFRLNQKEKNLAALVLAIGILELFIIALTTKFGWLIPLAIFVLLFFFYSVKYTLLGLSTLILLHIFVIRSSEKISLGEVAFGIYFFVVLAGWFLKKIFLERERIFTGSVHYALLAFFVLSALSIVPAFFFGVDLFKWFRELVPFFGYLLFFPFVDTVKNKKQINIILICILGLGFLIAIRNLIAYKRAVSGAVEFWQLAASRQVLSAPILVSIAVVAVSFFAFSKRRVTRFLYLALALLFGISMALTYSRGHWIATLIALIVLFGFVPFDRKLKIVAFLALSIITAWLILSLYLGSLGHFVIAAMGERFKSMAALGSDPSTLSRIVESKAVAKLILTNPIAGYGLGKTFSYKPILNAQMPTWYLHNAYLYLWFKTGLFGVLAFLFFFVGSIVNGYRISSKTTDPFLKALSTGIAGIFIAMLPLSLSSPQFIQKDSILIIVLGSSLIEIIRRKLSNSHR